MWGIHVKDAKKVVLTNENSYCDVEYMDLEEINVINKDYYYYISKGTMITFKVGTESSEGSYWAEICQAVNGNDITYSVCENLLKPPSGCTNNSNPVGKTVEKIDGKTVEQIYYALSIINT
jgi:hypothetical protein